MLDEKVDELSRVLHKVNILVHAPVHDQKTTFLVRELNAALFSFQTNAYWGEVVMQQERKGSYKKRKLVE